MAVGKGLKWACESSVLICRKFEKCCVKKCFKYIEIVPYELYLIHITQSVLLNLIYTYL